MRSLQTSFAPKSDLGDKVMTLVVGNDMAFYYNTATDASPTWVLIDGIGDLNVNLSVGEAEVDLRRTNWLLNLPSKFSGSLDVAIANDIGGTVFDALLVLFLARTQFQFASVDQAIATSGAEYFKAFGFFTEFPWSQETQEMSNHDATIALGFTEESGTLVDPSWETVS